MGVLLVLAVVVAGAATPFMAGTEGELNGKLVSPIWCGVFIYMTGLLGFLILQAFVREPLPLGKVESVPWWAWVGGLLSMTATVVALMIAKKMGSAYFTGASVTASLVVSIVLDHFGLVGFKQHPVSLARVGGAVLMVAGLWVVAKF